MARAASITALPTSTSERGGLGLMIRLPAGLSVNEIGDAVEPEHRIHDLGIRIAEAEPIENGEVIRLMQITSDIARKQQRGAFGVYRAGGSEEGFGVDHRGMFAQ